MTDQTIVAVYDTPAHAEMAVQDLLQAGVPDSAIHRHAQEGSFAGRETVAAARHTEGGGFWSGLFGGEPDHDTAIYDRSMAGGAQTVTVKVGESHVERVMQILESHAPIDLDERAGSYGLTTPAAGVADTAFASPAASQVADRASTETRDSGLVQLSEETLSVGKRLVNKGTTRIRRFVVETPVEEQVNLHEERVSVERHKVTDGRPVSDAFTDRTIEMTETAEEAVVSKSAHVYEEVGLRKDVSDRTETVRDTVRREDVEIVKVPGEVK